MKALTLVLLMFIFLIACTPSQVCFKEFCFDVEIADDVEEQSEGLMFRESINLKSGMLFIFDEEAKYSFWMKFVEFPLDIIWLNNDKEIVYMSNLSPCPEDPCPSIKTDTPAKYVLEINSGMIQMLNLSIGDKVVFK